MMHFRDLQQRQRPLTGLQGLLLLLLLLLLLRWRRRRRAHP
jgi:MYXO-CTERM domain-containing protein